jgi:excisionase family DNA binding protein
MTILSLREAAEQSSVSKSTVFRAIQSGRMSAAKDDIGNLAIDAAELFRVFPRKGSEVDSQLAKKRAEGHGAIDNDTVELRIRHAELAAEVKALQRLLEAAQKREDDLKSERDRWASQAERLAIAPPVPTPPVPTAAAWWPWKRTA